jgi:hypothetical protein
LVFESQPVLIKNKRIFKNDSTALEWYTHC